MQAAQLESIALIGESEIQGTCDERFAAVQEAFAANLNTGKDIGASVALLLTANPSWGVTLSIPIVGQQSVKFVYSTGTTTRRGSDFDTFNVTWQLVTF